MAEDTAPDEAPSKLREVLRESSFQFGLTTSKWQGQLPPVANKEPLNSSRSGTPCRPDTPASEMQPRFNLTKKILLSDMYGTPKVDDPDRMTGQLDRLLDRVKKIKAGRLARQEGLTNGRHRIDNPQLEILDCVSEWMTIKNSRTGEVFFYNRDTERVEFVRPFCLRSAQEIADRERAVHVLKEVPPAQRTTDQLLALSRLLKDCSHLQQFGVEILMEACRTMSHQKNGAGEAITWQEDSADKFYVLIRGSVGVWMNTGQGNLSAQCPHEICETGGPVGAVRVVVLGEGKVFGEQALMYDKKRNASIVTEIPCEFAIIEKHHFQDILKEYFVKAAKLRCSFIQTHMPVILGEQRIRQWEYIEGFFKEVPVTKGQMLCETGKTHDTLDLLYEGSCKVFYRSKHTIKGDSTAEKFALCELSPGQFLGASSILLGAPEPFDVICASDGKVLKMQKIDVYSRLPQLLRDLLGESEQIRIQRYGDLAKRAEVCSMVEDLSKGLLQEATVRRESLRYEESLRWESQTPEGAEQTSEADRPKSRGSKRESLRGGIDAPRRESIRGGETPVTHACSQVRTSLRRESFSRRESRRMSYQNIGIVEGAQSPMLSANDEAVDYLLDSAVQRAESRRSSTQVFAGLKEDLRSLRSSTSTGTHATNDVSLFGTSRGSLRERRSLLGMVPMSENEPSELQPEPPPRPRTSMT